MLIVGFVGETRRLGEEDELTFGREAELEIDTNPYLHRRLGLFRFEHDAWWLYNIGTAIALEVIDAQSSSRATVAPGAGMPITFRQCFVQFQASTITYRLELTVETAAASARPAVHHLEGKKTLTASEVDLNDEQRLLLTALAEPRIRNVGAARSAVPTNRQAAARLGWSMPKFNRKLDNLCTKFDRLGVPGVKGDLGKLATNRRQALVDHALRVHLVSAADLHLLDGTDATDAD